MFKRLLAATELVDFCDAPVLTALKIAEQNDAQLSILKTGAKAWFKYLCFSHGAGAALSSIFSSRLRQGYGQVKDET